MTVLLLTVGTGTRGRTEETILEPFGMSLRAAGCQRNILLPSRQTLPQAEMVREANPEFAIEIRPLPRDGDENDADACFVHFDAVFESLLASGVPPEEIIADITRGTKAMSAALLMAAAIHRAGKVRYLVGGRQNESGSAVPGTESPRDIEPAFIRLRFSLQLAEQHLRAFSYRAVETLLDPWLPLGARPQTPVQRQIAAWLWAARFWGAWDRFDYRGACGLLSGRPDPGAGLPAGLYPSAEQRDFLQRLAQDLPAADGERVKHGRNLAADLLANAERRLAAGHSEEALVRIYRILELITRYRLYVHNIDTECVKWNHPGLRAWREEMARRQDRGQPPGGRSLGRRHAAQLLAFLESGGAMRAGDAQTRSYGISQRLLDTKEWLGLSDADLRNRSLLIHGLEASAPQAGAALQKALEALRAFYFEEHERNRGLYQTARFPFQR